MVKALVCGTRDRGFESHYPPQKYSPDMLLPGCFFYSDKEFLFIISRNTEYTYNGNMQLKKTAVVVVRDFTATGIPKFFICVHMFFTGYTDKSRYKISGELFS